MGKFLTSAKQLGLFGVAAVCSIAFQFFSASCSVTMEQNLFGIQFFPTCTSQSSAAFISTVHINTLKYMAGNSAYFLCQIYDLVQASAV
jgi:hypothetical protein